MSMEEEEAKAKAVEGDEAGAAAKATTPMMEAEVLATKSEQSGAEFDQLDREAWLITQESPRVYVTENGKIREIFREVEVTKEVVKHRKSGVVVTVETTDHHVVDSEKSEF